MSFPSSRTVEYQYDEAGRRTLITYPGALDSVAYEYNDANRLTSVTDWDLNEAVYAYDDADRMTSATLPNGVVTTYGYDDADRLLSIDHDLGMSSIASVAYGDGLRDSVTVGMSTTTYTWDIAAGLPVVLQENDTRYIWGAHGLIAQVGATPDWHYYHADGLGSTIAVTDDVGAVEQTYEYDAYGAVTGGSGSLDNSFQFAGEQVDASTGLQYLRARYYDMETGRFISREPAAVVPGWIGNGYGYAGANPARLTDPVGLWPMEGLAKKGGGAIKSVAQDAVDIAQGCLSDSVCSGMVGGGLMAAGSFTGNPVLVAAGIAVTTAGDGTQCFVGGSDMACAALAVDVVTLGAMAYAKSGFTVYNVTLNEWRRKGGAAMSLPLFKLGVLFGNHGLAILASEHLGIALAFGGAATDVAASPAPAAPAEKPVRYRFATSSRFRLG